VIANIPYLTLAACHVLGIPSIAYCSLNWAAIHQYYFDADAAASKRYAQMINAYNSAECFLQPAPAMVMPGIQNGVPIGPVAQIGRNRRLELRSRLGLAANELLVLISLGGMDVDALCDKWSGPVGIRFLVPESWHSTHPDVQALESLGYPFVDLVRSVDALIAKPGYGSFVEAACNATPVLFLPREDWPEVPVLVHWLEGRGRCQEISYEAFRSGKLAEPLRELMAHGVPNEIAPAGIQEAVEHICRYLPASGD
jgi:hypothetical protein